VVGNVTATGIFSFFCAVIRFPAVMAPSLNDIQIHGRLVFHVMSYQPEELCLASGLLEIRRC